MAKLENQELVQGLSLNRMIIVTPQYEGDKLTIAEKYHLAIDSIESFCSFPGKPTRVRTKSGDIVQVKETPEEIHALINN